MTRWRPQRAFALAAVIAAAGASASTSHAAAVPAPRGLELHSWSTRVVERSGIAFRLSISPAYAADRAAATRWGDFFASLVHGAELSDLDAYIAPLAEVQQICGGRAYGCYAANRLVSIGEPSGATSAESVATHEYGHHVAFHRSNAPWVALDWGPKRWATTARTCARAADGSAFPGAEDARYPLNPGEAFAEAYRVLNEQQEGLPFSWPLVDPSFAPDDAALAAVREDVLHPWTRPTRRTIRASFAGARAKWAQKLLTPLDGVVSIRLTGAVGDAQLLADDGRTVLARASWTSSGAKAIEYMDCGRRSLVLRVTRAGGRSFRVNVSVP